MFNWNHLFFSACVIFFNFSVVLTPSPCGHSPYIFAAQNKGGECDTRFVAADVFFNPFVLLTPPSFGHLPYILLRKTQGRSVIHVFLYSSMCFLYNNIKHSHLLPLYCCVTRQRESVRFDFVTVAVFSTPPSFGHLPYILLRKTQRRREKHPVMLRGTAEEEGRSIEC